MTTTPDVTAAQLQEQLAALTARLSEVEGQLAELKRRSDQDIPEHVLMVISAAVSAYMGNRGRVKAVKLDRHKTWAAQGRQTVQRHVAR